MMRLTAAVLIVLSVALLVGCAASPEDDGAPSGTDAGDVLDGGAVTTPEDPRTRFERALTHGRRVTSNAGVWQVVYLTSPATIPLNEPFAVVGLVLDADGEPLDRDVDVRVDAGMPQHRHGMVRQPTLTLHGGGRFAADGLLFHMPGDWTLTFDVSADGITERAEDVVRLE